MKQLSLLLCLVFTVHVFSQQTEEEKAKQVVVSFFDHFHAQDSAAIKKLVSQDVILQRISKNKEGKVIVATESFDDLLKSIVSIPKTVSFQEKLLSFSIQVDGAMANVWTPYEFWFKGELSHCGVNSFQLFKNEKGEWKIIYLVDTAKREGCQ